MLPCPRLGTCGEADLHCPLPMPKHLKLGQRHLVGHPHRVGALVPLIPNIPHGVTDCNHKPVPAAVRQRAAADSNQNGGGKRTGQTKKGLTLYTSLGRSVLQVTVGIHQGCVRKQIRYQRSLAIGFPSNHLYTLTVGTVVVVVTCRKVNTSRRLPMAQHPELRQLNFIAYADTLCSRIPLIANISHCVPDWPGRQNR